MASRNHWLTALIVLHMVCFSGISAPAKNVPPQVKTPPAAAADWTDKERIGQDVPICAWRNPAVAPWAVLLCIHGLSLHASSYEPFGKRMCNLGVPTYAIDVRGFGSWQNTHECSEIDFDSAQADIKSALDAIHKAHPGLPVVL
ncbi:MAG: alpha/beta hydrolase, partial [Terriglobales bacterium]